MKSDLVAAMERVVDLSEFGTSLAAAIAIQKLGADEKEIEKQVRAIAPMDPMRQTFRKGMRWAANATTEEVREAILVAYNEQRHTL